MEPRELEARERLPLTRRVYLDYNATAPVRPELRAGLVELLFSAERGEFGNPSSVHWAGQAARRRLEAARTLVAVRLDRKPSEVVFTSGGTEANDLALLGTLARRPELRLITTAVEHPSVRAAAAALAAAGRRVETLGVDREGRLDLDDLARRLDGPALVSVMAANNETGVVFPIPELRALVHRAGGLLHVDATQAAGRVPLDLGADLLTLSGHKLGGLKGAGVLAAREGALPAPRIVGGAQERGLRAGTEAVPAIVALAEALVLALDQAEAEAARLSVLQARLEAGLRALGAHVLGAGAQRLPQTTAVRFSGVEREALLIALDLAGVAASSGSACASGSLEPSPVLLAMGLDAEAARSAIRLSMGFGTTAEDVEHTLAVLPQLLAQVRGS